MKQRRCSRREGRKEEGGRRSRRIKSENHSQRFGNKPSPPKVNNI